MTPKTAVIREQVEKLVADGDALRKSEASYWYNVGRKDDSDDPPKRTVQFAPEYHAWYSVALPLVRQMIPERAEEFELYFRDPKAREMDLSSYTIQDHISGVIILNHPRHQWASQAMTKFAGQVAIVKSVATRLDSLLTDVQGVLQAELLDDEVAVAGELLKKKHLRAAGAVAGVVLERHLAQVASTHRVMPRKKNPTLSDLNEALKAAGTYDLPQYRQVQYLTDLRNIAVHHKERDPTEQETQDLIQGVDRVIKNVF